MKPKNGKAKSKRTGLGVKYMVERKVKESRRKQRKIDKINKLNGKKKKDPGIPNLFPFKEALIRKEEERRAREETRKEKQRRFAAAERKGRKAREAARSLAELQADAASRGDAFEDEEEAAAAAADDQYGAGPAGLPESSRKAFYKEFCKVVEAADVLLEVLDARDPEGCRCRRVEQQVLAAGSDKRLVLVLNKIDLVPKEVVERWLKHLRNEFPTIAFKASTQSQSSRLMQSAHAAVGGRDSGASGCFGAQSLISLMGNFCRNKGIRTTIRVGVIGYPNVGKSSIINSLKRSKVCGVGAVPGFTKECKEISLDRHVKLIDSPGIVFADKSQGGADLILRNCVRVEDLDDPVPAVHSILDRCDPEMIMERYTVPAFSGTDEFLQLVAKRLGKVKRGGVPDYEGAARVVLQDWNQGKIAFYTAPPEASEAPAHVAAEIVSDWSAEFDIDAATADDDAMLGDAAMGDDDDAAPAFELRATVHGDDEPEDMEEESAYDIGASLGGGSS
mmetsp:Transcript_19812/g.59163  ORF Transcript_19812/g.59163 Transcript_19812/m.59163 type:complete len:505 (+) Transcript_19812:297-1811(+)|eukprot:CAMPEP_0182928668 /NCGR_PEP_ID=MMETSP0105_2-20130417/15703_1 /TAXON_ID=81532 ORGANISM="Acanthoeca-like sp., Strain 10tr" /NCGR_SAMPLE_ID=MMETSP0105_2 /ASSEMBLY_ACC=CAM_ASM_000205 /LENGTH=504 /DNA_ID=CAMNT_0025066677 /DNA_START=278 /DNA_END=1792 /DNA_ORIENTATION=-